MLCSRSVVWWIFYRFLFVFRCPKPWKSLKIMRNSLIFQLSTSFNMSIVVDLILTSIWPDLGTKSHPNLEKIELKMTFDFIWISASNFYRFLFPTWPIFRSPDAARAPQEGHERHQKGSKNHGFLKIPAGSPCGGGFGWILVHFWCDFRRIWGWFLFDFGRILGSRTEQTR